MDNAPGHFPAVERNDIKVLFFPPSCSSWKQPSDVGIIAALKKSYKYLYLKVVLDFFEVEGPQKNKQNGYVEEQQVLLMVTLLIC